MGIPTAVPMSRMTGLGGNIENYTGWESVMTGHLEVG
jgi:hypothetical protein